jgi:hypothetical protein
MYDKLKTLFTLLWLPMLLPEALAALDWSLLSSASWEYEGKLTLREDARVSLPWDFSMRAQFIDCRPTATAETFVTDGNPALSGALYHKASGSRLLYGVIDDVGLSARLRNLWLHALPFVEYHKPSSLDLATEPFATKQAQRALSLSIPRLGKIDGFATLLLDEQCNPAVSAGVDARLSQKSVFRLEGFYTDKELPPRTQSTWFSTTPYLPARYFSLYALSAVYTSTFFDVAADCAFSNTFAYGRDLYGNFSMTIGDKPWQVSLAADGAGCRYVGSNGAASGAGFRVGGRLERFGKRQSRFRLSTSLRAPAIFAPFDRSASLVAYYFPARPRGRLFSLSRASLSLSRNALEWKKIEDKAETSLAFTLGPIYASLTETLTTHTAAETQPPPYPLPDASSLTFAQSRASCKLLYRVSVFQFGADIGYSVTEGKTSLWDTAFHASVRGKHCRLAFEISSPCFPEDWTLAFAARSSLP